MYFVHLQKLTQHSIIRGFFVVQWSKRTRIQLTLKINMESCRPYPSLNPV